MLRRFIVTAVTCAAMATAQGGVSDLLIPAPWSLGIAATKWLVSGTERVLYVEVTGEGATVDQARQQGFRLAVEHAVGTVVASETEVRDARVRRDEIITYASGYVDRFETTDQQWVNGGRVQIKMKIWIRSSKLANRLLNKSETAGAVEGGRISAQIQTIQHERTSGDRLLKTVLADFPARAFRVEMEKTQVTFDANRQGQLAVAFYLSWSPEYIDSIAEAVAATNQRRECDSFPGCANVTSEIEIRRQGFGSTTRARFDDTVADQSIRTEMIQSAPAIRVSIVDAQGNEQFKQCFYAKELDHRDHAPWYYVNVKHGKITLDGSAVKRFNTSINLSKLPTDRLDQVKVAIVRSTGC